MDGQQFDKKHSGIFENTSYNQDESNIGEDLNEHVESIHKEPSNQEEMKTEKNYDKHFKCEVCEKIFYHKSHLKDHITS